jgi:hypothetical protein
VEFVRRFVTACGRRAEYRFEPRELVLGNASVDDRAIAEQWESVDIGPYPGLAYEERHAQWFSTESG